MFHEFRHSDISKVTWFYRVPQHGSRVSRAPSRRASFRCCRSYAGRPALLDPVAGVGALATVLRVDEETSEGGDALRAPGWIT
jgi:hypothetical protein